jgi:large subunit ribosomal protein L13
MTTKTHTLDAENKILGRIAVEAAVLLRGKNKPEFQRYLDQGDSVVIINIDKMKVSGKKMKDKIYQRHSGWPGGLKSETLEEVFKRDSRVALKRAIYGMLPKNKLRDKMIKRLELYKGKEER